MFAGWTDRQLLEKFRSGEADAEAAFRALVQRHGTMVLHVCGATLAHSQDLEDAFQATFLVLVRLGPLSGCGIRSVHGFTALPVGSRFMPAGQGSGRSSMRCKLPVVSRKRFFILLNGSKRRIPVVCFTWN